MSNFGVLGPRHAKEAWENEPGLIANIKIGSGHANNRYKCNPAIFPSRNQIKSMPFMRMMLCQELEVVASIQSQNHHDSRLPSGNQTWQWKIPGKSPINGGFMGRSSINYKWYMFHCHVWLPEGNFPCPGNDLVAVCCFKPPGTVRWSWNNPPVMLLMLRIWVYEY